MGSLSRSILQGLAIGNGLGAPIGQGLAAAGQQEFEREQRAQQLKDQVSLMAVQNPDFAQALQDIMPGQTVDGQQSVKPLAMTPEQQQAIDSGQSIPEVPTMELGNKAYNPSRFKSLNQQDLIADEQRKADAALRLHMATNRKSLEQGQFDPNSGKFLKLENGRLVAYDIPLMAGQGAAAPTEQSAPQTPAFAPAQPSEPQSSSQGGFVPTGQTQPVGQPSTEQVALPSQATASPSTLTGTLAQKLQAQTQHEAALEKMRQDAQDANFNNQSALLDKRLANQNEILKGKNAQHEIDPDAISHDTQAVLEGRNTLQDIRKTVGRSNDAAAYMKAVREEINKQDPKFDYIASNAGGTSVSSPYVQKSMIAINSVLPNLEKIKDLSSQVDRVGIKGVDNLIQQAGIQFGNKKISNFRQARNLLADEVGVALGQGAVSDMKLKLGFDVTDPSVPDEVFASNIGVIEDFLQNRKTGLNSLRYSSPTVKGINQQNAPAAPAASNALKIGRFTVTPH